MTDSPPTPELASMLSELEVTDNALEKYREIFINELKKGCNNDTEKESSLKCLVTYVHDLPDENVKGKFLALDLGGTNFRVLCVKIARTYLDVKAKKYGVSEEVMRGSGEQLFDHIAECLYQFTTEHKINQDNLPLGFTFSFPCEQRGLEVGILTQWTKGFSCPGVEGKNVVELLRQAIERKKDLAIDVVAVLNDTTGTLMSCAWKKPNAKIGLIIGTGTNACYVEKVANVSKFVGDKSRPYVVINTESGAFGGGGQVDFVRTKWDKDLDADSINPGVNIMEKMISGMYLGEFVRRLLVTAVERQFIFEGVCTEKLKTNGSFDSKFVSDIEGDLPGQHTNARRVLNSLGYGSPTEQDCVDVHYVCFIAWQRAGRMVSAQMAGLLNHMDYKDVTIGVDGSLYRFHPGFADLMNKKIRELTDPSIQFTCAMAEDGSGRGAALVAATAPRGRAKSGSVDSEAQRSVRVAGDTADGPGGGGVVDADLLRQKPPGDEESGGAAPMTMMAQDGEDMAEKGEAEGEEGEEEKKTCPAIVAAMVPGGEGAEGVKKEGEVAEGEKDIEPFPSAMEAKMQKEDGVEGGKAEGEKAEGGKAEGGKAEGGKAEGGKAEGGKAEEGKAEGGKAEGGKAEEGKAEGEKAEEEKDMESFPTAMDAKMQKEDGVEGGKAEEDKAEEDKAEDDKAEEEKAEEEKAEEEKAEEEKAEEEKAEEEKAEEEKAEEEKAEEEKAEGETVEGEKEEGEKVEGENGEEEKMEGETEGEEKMEQKEEKLKGILKKAPEEEDQAQDDAGPEPEIGDEKDKEGEDNGENIDGKDNRTEKGIEEDVKDSGDKDNENEEPSQDDKDKSGESDPDKAGEGEPDKASDSDPDKNQSTDKDEAGESDPDKTKSNDKDKEGDEDTENGEKKDKGEDGSKEDDADKTGEN